MRVLLVGPFDMQTGYGNDLVGMARGFVQLGHDVHLAPLSINPPIPQDVAQLLCKQRVTRLDLAVVHVNPTILQVLKGTRQIAEKVVGWSMWEWSEYFDELPDDPSRQPLRQRLRDFDLLLSYDHVTEEAFASHVPEECAHRRLQGGFWADDWSRHRYSREWSGTFRFGMLGRLHDRKNPFAAIRAFAALKEEHGDGFDAELHLKTQILGLHPMIEQRYPGVRVYLADWPQLQVAQFYGSLHCLLAPSRGEGKNVPALEAQATGIPVIATDFGGHREWLSDEWAYPLRYTLVDHAEGQWAEPDEEHLKELMWHVYTHREEARQKGEIAAATIPRMCDWTAVIRHLELALREVEGREPIHPV